MALSRTAAVPSAHGSSAGPIPGVGMRNVGSFSVEPDIREWSNRVAVNPARVPPDRAREPAVAEAVARMRAATPAAVARLDELSA